MEKTFLMKVVEIRLHCDECGEAMDFAGEITRAYMKKDYSYRCPKCKHNVISNIKYPKIEYVSTNTPVVLQKN